ncbi:MAG: undecaprenyl diphosphate synthase family protein, partial [Patescibacteria group bacterium]
ALSIDNLQKRKEGELRFLTQLCKLGISELKVSPEFKSRNIRFKTIGRWKDFFPEFEPDIKELEESSWTRTERTFTLALAYDGTEEDRAQKDAIRKNVPPAMPLTPEIENEYLWSGFLPDVDLCIRTGGEPHLSAGFLMHKMANAYLAFPKVCWPDFSPRHLKKITDEFRSRERRLGA